MMNQLEWAKKILAGHGVNAHNRREFLQRATQVLFGSAAYGMVPNFLAGCTPKVDGVKSSGKSPEGLSLNGQPDKKFLFVFAAMGGASINDSFMAVKQSETLNASLLNVYPDNNVRQAEGTDLRGVDLKMDTLGPLPFIVDSNQSRFLAKYAKEIMVTTVSGTTVAHPVGQARSVNGFEAWNGRTIQEAVAAQYGRELLIPNVNMATVGFAENGKDPSVPRFAIAEQISNAAFFPFGLHGSLGIQGAPSDSLIQLARNVRNQNLEPESPFMRTYGKNPKVAEWMEYRSKLSTLEKMDLINKLNPFEDTKDFPFKSFGLNPNPRGELFRQLFNNLGADDLQNQALLAYLLVTSGLTCAVTFGLTMNVTVDGSDAKKIVLTNTPTGFDYSHNAHRGTQATLWHRSLEVIDRLITLLRATEYQNGQSYWDHSLIYVATEFGRDKKREANVNEFTTGHNTNNGVVMISPLVNGGRVLGGVAKDTLMTYGFDPETGNPDANRTMDEKHIYAGILQILGVDTSGSGLPNMKAMKRPFT